MTRKCLADKAPLILNVINPRVKRPVERLEGMATPSLWHRPCLRAFNMSLLQEYNRPAVQQRSMATTPRKDASEPLAMGNFTCDLLR